jgi:hypothetical protein
MHSYRVSFEGKKILYCTDSGRASLMMVQMPECVHEKLMTKTVPNIPG